MTTSISRRRLLRGAGLAAGTAVLATPSILRGQAAVPRVTSVTLATGFTVILNEYMAAKRFDLKHGVNIDVINSYVSVTNYYNDFTAGTFEMGIGSWDTWAARFLAGVPLKLISTITDYDLLNIVAMKGGPGSVADLRGKTLSATLSSGAYRLGKAPRDLPESKAIVIAGDRFVSKDHAVILVEPNEIVLTDPGSTNGCFVNGNKITHATLENGDEIRLGESVFKFTKIGN